MKVGYKKSIRASQKWTWSHCPDVKGDDSSLSTCHLLHGLLSLISDQTVGQGISPGRK